MNRGTMVQGPTNIEPSVMSRILRGRPEQLALPLDIPGDRKHRLVRHGRAFAMGFAPNLGSQLLRKVGLPVVAATSPAVIRMLDPRREEEIVPNLLVGSALGGAWGAAVGALIPRTSDGVRISRFLAMGKGAGAGVALAPPITLAFKYVGDWLGAPLEKAKKTAEDRADNAELELDKSRATSGR